MAGSVLSALASPFTSAVRSILDRSASLQWLHPISGFFWSTASSDQTDCNQFHLHSAPLSLAIESLDSWDSGFGVVRSIPNRFFVRLQSAPPPLVISSLPLGIPSS